MKAKNNFTSLILFILFLQVANTQIGFPSAEFDPTDLFNSMEQVDNYAYDVAVQNNSKIVVVGTQKNDTSNDIIVIRLHEDGSPDYSFQDNGSQLYHLSLSDKECARSVKIVNEKIIVAGCSGPNSFLLRLNKDGSRDQSFGNDGVVFSSSLSVINKIAIVEQKDSYHIFAAGSYLNDKIKKAGIVKFSSDGEKDRGFGNNGLAGIESNIESEFNDIKITAAGAVYASGDAAYLEFSDSDALVAKFNLKGKSNKLFGYGYGFVTVDAPISGKSNGVQSLSIGKDNKITICGSYESTKDYDAYLCRLNEDGSLDKSFGRKKDGYYSSDYLNETDEGTSLVIQEDGKIIIGGRSDFEGNFDFTLTRLHSNGLPDTSFARNSWQLGDFSSGNDSIKAMYIHDDEYLITVGNSSGKQQDRIVLAKYNLSNSQKLSPSYDLAKIW